MRNLWITMLLGVDLVLVSDSHHDGVRRIVVDAQGAGAAGARAVLSNIREVWAPTAGYNVDGAGEDLDGGVVRWTFDFNREPVNEAPEPSDASSEDSSSSSWTIATAD